MEQNASRAAMDCEIIEELKKEVDFLKQTNLIRKEKKKIYFLNLWKKK